MKPNYRPMVRVVRPAMKDLTGWPHSVATISILNRDGTECTWLISLSVNGDSRCGRVGEPRLHIHNPAINKSGYAKVRGAWRKKP